MVTMMKNGKPVKITKLKDFLEFKGQHELLEQLVVKNTKKKKR